MKWQISPLAASDKSWPHRVFYARDLLPTRVTILFYIALHLYFLLPILIIYMLIAFAIIVFMHEYSCIHTIFNCIDCIMFISYVFAAALY